MRKAQAEAHAAAMVASMHAAGARAVKEARAELDADRVAAEALEKANMEQIVDFLLLDIGELADRHALLLSKGVSPQQIAAATPLVAAEKRREAYRRRRLGELEREIGHAGRRVDDDAASGDAWAASRTKERARLSEKAAADGAAAGAADAARAAPAAGGVVSGAATRSALRAAVVAEAVELVREGLVDLEVPLAEAVADAREQLAERVLQLAHSAASGATPIDWSTEVEPAAIVAAKAEGWGR